jgi:alpha-D-ribose 1-methylphosphonate 5-triphosphate diphosphatase PhnM
MVQSWLTTTCAELAGDVAQAVERLPSKHKALNSILNTTKKKKKKSIEHIIHKDY